MLKLYTHYKQLLADTVTPVSIYLKLRDKFANSILLESSDYHGNENSFSYICFHPIARFEVKNGTILTQFPKTKAQSRKISSGKEVITALEQFIQSFEVEKNDFSFINNGLFGYMAYDAVKYFEDIAIKDFENDSRAIPTIVYQVYQYIIAINHFKNELYLFEHLLEGEKSHLAEIENLIFNRNIPQYHFQILDKEQSNFSDEEFLAVIEKAKNHCQLGDVFQMVVSRRFEQKFQGDEFNVYRALRSINPSPYLFYFDYGSYKIFGSSPEAQIVVKNGKASIFPIAGTFKRTGNDEADFALAQELLNDPKENSEHVMLVDLARNDLSRNGFNVSVETFKEIQYYSHVIHLVSKVTADIPKHTPTLQLVADTFPAGTLSGAPKHKAMELINLYEKGNRGYYGGCIGFLGFNGEFNQAIMIRSFLSKNNVLYFQAGAGVVAKSDTQSELQEVNNKVSALRKSLQDAQKV
ncbi:anthranilate synthase component I family protein [Raineya orbicola]|jgi:anthranilate synthase component 1|uniref:Anthranilate synthase component 1 n=1 Tax=Raineya orbicola TaxID=2016530 RepID=A0A2N3IJ99_9BACT|nr:anthranilate synthase component I family protein [Raineya orbicola]PKQ70394.1 Anthranilate/para-aminobenzoate synthases component I [Raineya orbicola]